MNPEPVTNAPRAAQRRKRLWAPRMWEGCNFAAWMRLLKRHRFAVEWPYLYIAAVVTFMSCIHTVLGWLQDAWYAGDVRRTVLRHPPLFIIGHWRTGTTLLHELLILDPRHTYPNTYECMDPNHFLLTEGFMTRWMRFLAPSHRPMDNMAAGFERPQEDEFALCMLGQPSPYLSIAFPNHPPQDEEYLSLEAVPPAARDAWKSTLLRFLKQLTFRDPTHRRLVLKSPTHTARIPLLLEMFPDAQFVHIVRDPYVVFPSTVNLWKSLARAHGLQTPRFAGIEEYVFENFNVLYERLEAGRRLVPPGHFHEVRYEELVRDPVRQMQELYAHLGLGEFDRYRARLEEFLATSRGYETNRWDLSPEDQAKVTLHWGKVIERYGYGRGNPGSPSQGSR